MALITTSNKDAIIVALATITFTPIAYYILYTTQQRKNIKIINEPPISCPIPFIGQGFAFLQNFSQLIHSLRTKYNSSIFTIINFGQRMTFVTDIQSIRKIWSSPTYFNFADFAFQAEANFSGIETKEEIEESGVGAATLAKYAHTMRKEEDLEKLAKRFDLALKEALGKVPMLLHHNGVGDDHEDQWQTVNLKEFTSIIVWYAAGRSLFGNGWLRNVDVLESLRQYIQFDNDAPLIVGGMPHFLIKKGLKARDYIVEHLVLPIIQNQKEYDEDDNDDDDNNGHEYIRRYIDQLKKAYQDKDNGDIKIAARLIGLLFAINTNTMNLLFWTVARVLTTECNEFRQKLQNEVEDAMTSFNTWKDIKSNTPLLSSLIIETLRFHADPNSFRVVEKDCVISGLGEDGSKTYKFRKGDSVVMLSSFDQLKNINNNNDDNNNKEVNKNKDNNNNNTNNNRSMNDEEKFIPERWMKYTTDATFSKNVLPLPPSEVLVPFGGGKHLCPGRFFATVEIHYVIAFCFQHFEFELLKDGGRGSQLPKKVVELSTPINQPKEEMLIRMRRRRRKR